MLGCRWCPVATGFLVFEGNALIFVCGGFFCFTPCQLVPVTQEELFPLDKSKLRNIRLCIHLFVSFLWTNLSSFFLLLSLKWEYLGFFLGFSFYVETYLCGSLNNGGGGGVCWAAAGVVEGW